MSNQLSKEPKKSQEDVFVINTGTKKYTVKDEHGRVMGEFFWNPADSGIAGRYKDVTEYLEGLEKTEIKEGMDVADVIAGIDRDIVEKMKYLLNDDSVSSLFTKVQPLSMLMNGKSYIEDILDKIAYLIEKEGAERVRRAKVRLNKYTQGYHK